MRMLKGALFVLCTAALFGAFSPTSKADEWNKKTIVTLNEPIEVSGHVLDPGQYVFQLADSPSNRNIVQIWNGDQSHLIMQVQAVTAYRADVPGHTVMRIDERPINQAEAMTKWFYPGENFGVEFVSHYHHHPRQENSYSYDDNNY